MTIYIYIATLISFLLIRILGNKGEDQLQRTKVITHNYLVALLLHLHICPIQNLQKPKIDHRVSLSDVLFIKGGLRERRAAAGGDQCPPPRKAWEWVFLISNKTCSIHGCSGSTDQQSLQKRVIWMTLPVWLHTTPIIMHLPLRQVFYLQDWLTPYYRFSLNAPLISIHLLQQPPVNLYWWKHNQKLHSINSQVREWAISINSSAYFVGSGYPNKLTLLWWHNSLPFLFIMEECLYTKFLTTLRLLFHFWWIVLL